MNLQSGTYYWPTTLTDAPTYPALDGDIVCDVLIIGGGSSGAQCAYYLAEQDVDVVVIEKETIGSGSTSTNTALIQYSGEKMFTQLINSFGPELISRHLYLLKQAIDEIESASKRSPIDPDFFRRDTLYFASSRDDVKKLKDEYNLLKQHGFHLDFLTKEEIEANYPFSKEAAIYSYHDGEINPYKFSHGLMRYAADKGVRIFEHTEMNGHHFDRQENRMIVSTKNRQTIRARYVIFAAGYEGIDLKMEKMVSFSSTYTVTTKPVNLATWYNRTLIWETARPYIYMRTTADNRIIIGGLDDSTTYPEDRDSKLKHKADLLIQECNKRFPDIHAESAYANAAFYGGTVDGLPIVGVYNEYPNSYFLFAFGDNGTVYSQMLSKLITEEIIQGKSDDLLLYRQDRPLV
ncbi:MAG: NAD(P)/FAD-dependent oxidoreductase [Lysinibacillus sp.]